jgi:hypothetical protein
MLDQTIDETFHSYRVGHIEVCVIADGYVVSPLERRHAIHEGRAAEDLLRYQEWKALRRQALRRDGYQCTALARTMPQRAQVAG